FAYQCVPVKMYRMMELKRRDMSVFLESRLKIVKKGYTIIEVPAFWQNRSEGKTKLRFGRLISYLYVIFKVKWSGEQGAK
ncbi:MAG: hypothetical protein K6B52_04020, partial [Clostridiales bacterium]|nr:hypothetical protein [Clostridiales bacterium]